MFDILSQPINTTILTFFFIGLAGGLCVGVFIGAHLNGSDDDA